MDDQEVLQQATEILAKYRVAQLFAQLLNDGWKYKSTQTVQVTTNVKELSLPSIASGVRLRCAGQEFVLGVSEFQTTLMPNGEATMSGDAYAFFNRELVLHTSAHKDDQQYGGSVVSVSTYSFSLKSFKAGPWLEKLGECLEELESASNRADETARQKKVAEQASKIDLGHFATKKDGRPKTSSPRSFDEPSSRELKADEAAANKKYKDPIPWYLPIVFLFAVIAVVYYIFD